MKMFRLRNAGVALLAACMAFTLTSCSDDDDDKKVNTVEGRDMWGEVLRGDDMTLQFFPDHFAYLSLIHI
mgnify:FL=1